MIRKKLLLLAILMILILSSCCWKYEKGDEPVVLSTEQDTETEVIESTPEEIESEVVESILEETEPEVIDPIPEVTEPEVVDPTPEETEPEVIDPIPEVTEPEVVDPIPEVTEPEMIDPIPEVTEPEVEDETEDTSHYIPIPEEWNLIVVNKWNKLPENYKIELTEVSNGKRVDSRISEPLQQMFEDAESDGIPLMVREGYRTTEEQQSILDEKIQSYIALGYIQLHAEQLAKEWVAEPGTSEHELGLAVDINVDSTDGHNNRAYAWLAGRAHEYGFILRYPKGKEDITGIAYEPWHYRYVGIEAAQEIYEKELCLEEYILTR